MSISAKILYQPSALLRTNPVAPQSRRRPEQKIDRDENVNGKHGRFLDKSGPSKNHRIEPGHHSRSSADNPVEQKWANGLSPLEHKNRQSANRQRQLESLRRMEERIQNRNAKRLQLKRTDKFSIFCLDIEDIVGDKCTANWIKYPDGPRVGPEVRILYSLVLGKGELIVFGGIRKELSAQGQTEDHDSEVYNEVLFIKPPQYAI